MDDDDKLVLMDEYSALLTKAVELNQNANSKIKEFRLAAILAEKLYLAAREKLSCEVGCPYDVDLMCKDPTHLECWNSFFVENLSSEEVSYGED